jgi:tetratricopeptide (TPR) repeat protein
MTYVQTRLAYRRFVERFGPDDFYNLKEWVDKHLESMVLSELLSFWRLGGFDVELFSQSSKRISSLLVDANDEEKMDLLQGIERMWSSFYVMQQKYGIALDAGLLLFEMDRYEESKRFLEIAIQEDPDDVVSTLYYCLAICCFELGMDEEGLSYTRKLLEVEPDHEEALALVNHFDGD